MKKILVATDFSKVANNAMEYAGKFASEHQCELVLFTLQNVSVHAQNARFTSSSMFSILERKSEMLREMAVDLSKRYNIEVDTYFASGYFYDELNKAISETNPDILVMGMAQKSMEQELLGNTTTAVIHKVKIPVLSIPEGVQYNGIHHVLYASDMMKSVHRLALQKIKEIVGDLGGTVEVFHVSRKVTEVVEKVKEIEEVMEGTPYHFKSVVSDKIIEEIRKEALESKADILIMVPHRYGFWDSLVHRSKTRMLASGNQIPLLTILL